MGCGCRKRRESKPVKSPKTKTVAPLRPGRTPVTFRLPKGTKVQR